MVSPEMDSWLSPKYRPYREALLLLVAAVPRLVKSWTDHGVFFPDEIYQSLEPAHRFTFGYGFQAWEFIDGARSWLFPGLIGCLWKVAQWMGMTHSLSFVLLARVMMVALTLASVLACMRLADHLAGPGAGLVAGTMSALFPASLVLSFRCLSETASAPFVAWAALWLYQPSRRKMQAAGALLAIATFLRYQNGILAIGLLAVLAAERRWHDLRQMAGSAGIIAALGALLDWVTWGRLFHSLRVYLQFNLVEGKASLFGVSPPSYYVETLLSSTGWTLLIVAIGTVLAWRKARALVIVSLVFMVLHSMIPHKELRFLMPAMPLLLTAAAVGVIEALAWLNQKPVETPDGALAGAPAVDVPQMATELSDETPQKPLPEAPQSEAPRSVAPEANVSAAPMYVRLQAPIFAVCIVLAISMSARASSMNFGQMGIGAGTSQGETSVWHWNEPVNVLLEDVGRRADLCGLAFVAYLPVASGGYTYLHRDVPITNIPIDLLQVNGDTGIFGRWTNYVIAPSTFPIPKEYKAVRIHGSAAAYRREGPCVPQPAEVAKDRFSLQIANEWAMARLSPTALRAAAAASGPSGAVTSGNAPGGPLVAPQPAIPAAPSPAQGAAVPLAQVDPSILVPLLESELAKAPQNALLQRQYADYCWDRRMPCAKSQNERLLELVPGDPVASERMKQLQ